jgi:hypothetical protein
MLYNYTLFCQLGLFTEATSLPSLQLTIAPTPNQVNIGGRGVRLRILVINAAISAKIRAESSF